MQSHLCGDSYLLGSSILMRSYDIVPLVLWHNLNYWCSCRACTSSVSTWISTTWCYWRPSMTSMCVTSLWLVEINCLQYSWSFKSFVYPGMLNTPVFCCTWCHLTKILQHDKEVKQKLFSCSALAVPGRWRHASLNQRVIATKPWKWCLLVRYKLYLHASSQ